MANGGGRGWFHRKRHQPEPEQPNGTTHSNALGPRADVDGAVRRTAAVDQPVDRHDDPSQWSPEVRGARIDERNGTPAPSDPPSASHPASASGGEELDRTEPQDSTVLSSPGMDRGDGAESRPAAPLTQSASPRTASIDWDAATAAALSDEGEAQDTTPPSHPHSGSTADRFLEDIIREIVGDAAADTVSALQPERATPPIREASLSSAAGMTQQEHEPTPQATRVEPSAAPEVTIQTTIRAETEPESERAPQWPSRSRSVSDVDVERVADSESDTEAPSALSAEFAPETESQAESEAETDFETRSASVAQAPAGAESEAQQRSTPAPEAESMDQPEPLAAAISDAGTRTDLATSTATQGASEAPNGNRDGEAVDETEPASLPRPAPAESPSDEATAAPQVGVELDAQPSASTRESSTTEGPIDLSTVRDEDESAELDDDLNPAKRPPLPAPWPTEASIAATTEPVAPPSGDVSRETLVRPTQELPVSRETGPQHGGTPLADQLADETRRRVALDESVLPLPPSTRILTISNQKGGVGKTTTAVNLAAALARAGAHVLVIDLDPQGNASTALGVDHQSEQQSVYEVLVADLPLADVIRPSTEHEHLDCVPATIHLAGAEIELVSLVAREQRLRRALDTHLASMDYPYDYVFIDCPPSLGLLTINAFVAAREVLIPIQCEYYALEGLSQLLSNIELIEKHLNSDLRLSTILLTMYDSRTNLAQQVAQEVRDHFPSQTLDTIIPRSVRVSEAPSYGQSVISYDYASSGSLSYREAAAEIARRSASNPKETTDGN
jgi:cellulose biosynthesis protein BcsQ